ncbi:glycoside hydrolase family 92 protein [Dendrothele bispora CBS 962.96]|uniref:Glycoside hydrolase family 92 protein n=1 Tax=Dendrothele bispora (strain CBS 962.96) TaxID=1314807 RepID=A0A4S8M5U0_DENBC|nr:glycoside hydrolase family 92 protein [Dendrothele bispora CBS 962.96]
MFEKRLLLLSVLFLTPKQLSAAPQNPLDSVNLFIGTVNGGHTFPGATIPHGMVKVGMDTDSPGNHAGYDGDPQYNVTGFSQLHQEGTGGAVPLSNFKLFPIHNCTIFEQCLTTIDSRKIKRKTLPDGSPDDFATPGYFSTNLSNSIRVELTATRRTALHKYTFPSESTTPRILIDVTNDGQISGVDPELDIDPDTGRIMASGNYAVSFGPGRYNAYTCVDFEGFDYDFDGPIEYGPYKINYPDLWGTDLAQHYYSWGSEHGGLVGFPANLDSINKTSTILARVGLSLISTEQACGNAEEEIPDWDFDRVVRDSQEQWFDILSRVQVDTEGVDDNITTLLYSSLYRTHLLPADYTGENPNWESTEPYYDAFYCNWDTYRTLFPLMSMHDPVNFARIVRGMIDIQKNEGWLPECREMGQKSFVQGGSHGDPILAEFFIKYQNQAEDLGVSVDDLYAALIADAEDTPKNWNIQGRQADIWKEKGYIPSDTTYRGGANTKQVSRSIEYAFDDFAISQVAKLLGKTEDAAKYAARAGNFINSWNPNITVPDSNPNITGFFQPKFANGTWNYTDPRHCSVNDPLQATCFLNAIRRDGFYESSPIVYSQYVPQDTAKLIELQGGKERFIQRLDWIFDNNYFDSTNEPSQQIPFMYHYADKPGMSTQRSRMVIETSFNTSVNGLPGNDDSGAMGSYVFFYLAGLYPLPATKQILLSSPYFPSISFYNPLLNTTTTIKSNNFTGNPSLLSDSTGLTTGNILVKNVTIDGIPYKSNCYLEWDDVFSKSTTVVLELTDDINVNCGSDENALPPSLSTGGYD